MNTRYGNYDSNNNANNNNNRMNYSVSNNRYNNTLSNISSNKVPVEFVDGGALGFNFFESNVEGNYIDLKVTYTMTFPVGLLGDFSFDSG